MQAARFALPIYGLQGFGDVVRRRLARHATGTGNQRELAEELGDRLVR